MKKQIRKGVFETNSSSTHAICIATEDVLNIPNKIHFEFGDYEWECRKLVSMQDRVNYLYTALTYINDINTITKYLTFIANTLKAHGVEDIEFDSFELSFYEWEGVINAYAAPLEKDSDEWYGIDHGRETREFVDAVCTDEDRLLHYLFSNKSYIETGNDNDEYDVNINVDYPHEEYYKGN